MEKFKICYKLHPGSKTQFQTWPEPELCCVIVGVLRAENLSDLPQQKFLQAAAPQVSVIPEPPNKRGWGKIPPSSWGCVNPGAALKFFLGEIKIPTGALGSSALPELSSGNLCCWNLLMKVLKQFPIFPPCCPFQEPCFAFSVLVFSDLCPGTSVNPWESRKNQTGTQIPGK